MPDGEPDRETVSFEAPRFKSLYLSDVPYATRKSREEGERDLEDLAVSDAAEEGAWAFSEDKGRWMSIRTRASQSDADGQSPSEMNADTLFFDMGQIGTRVSVYHIHPQYAVDLEAQQLRKVLGGDGLKGLDEKREEAVRYISQVYCALPSYLDIESAADYAGMTQGCDLDFKIVSPAGTTTFTLDKSHPLFGGAAEKYASLSAHFLTVIGEHGYGSADVINEAMEGALSISIEPPSSRPD